MPALDAPTAPRIEPRDRALDAIAAKVHAGRRLSAAEGERLYSTADLWTVCGLADLVRRRLHGDVAWYNVNRHVNYSNICALSCRFCSFYRKKEQEGAYQMPVEEIAQQAAAADAAGATEIHIVGGLHPWLPLDYYLDMLRAIRAAAPALHIKAFTAVEIVHLARVSGRGRDGTSGIRAVLRELIDAGLGSLPGGGAEVFDDRVHDEAYKGKIRAGTWMDVHRVAHELGLNTNATMLYGHIEGRAERVRHLLLLRREQDRALAAWARSQSIGLQPDPDEGGDGAVLLTGPAAAYQGDRLPRPGRDGGGAFQTIIPLPFIPTASQLAHLPGPSGLENLRTLAVSRLMLDNFPHVKAFWIMHTLEMAQVMLQNGADDIDGTVVWYDITKVGGAGTHQEVSTATLRRVIREAGFKPMERDTLYRPVLREGPRWRVA
jgi:aminodeoxyfutalosine synthase